MASGIKEPEGWFARAESALEAAKVLARQGFPNEAVSRSYYAMFYAAKAALIKEGVAATKHSGVIAAFGRLFAKTGRIDPRLHGALIEAFELRAEADYQVEPAIWEREATAEVTIAEEFLHAVRALLWPGEQ